MSSESRARPATIARTMTGPDENDAATPPNPSSAAQNHMKRTALHVRIADLQQAVMQVLLVGRERRAPTPGPADDGKKQVKERHSEHSQRHGQRDQRRATPYVPATPP